MAGAPRNFVCTTHGRTVGIDEVASVGWHIARSLWFPKAAFSIDECIRIGCRERGSCQCAASRQRPRVLHNSQHFEFYADYQGGVWCPARATAARRKVTKAQRERILARDSRRCRKCGATNELEVDHIVPVSRGGTNDDANLQTLCAPCNARKATHPPESPRA